jgi:hypothetical protein
MARLLVKTEGINNSVIELNLGVNRIGRGPTADFRIEHPTVSGVHCEFILSDGAMLLRDCDSTNGTFVNGQPVKQAALRSGQTVHLGEVELMFEMTDAAVAIPKPVRAAPALPVALQDGSMPCKRHPASPVTYRCTHCHEEMCDACVHRLRRKGGKLHKLCPLCSHPCEPIVPPKPKKRSLLAFLKDTVRLPFMRLTGRGK